jgi:O-antigen/teichoic acid export membrane protein
MRANRNGRRRTGIVGSVGRLRSSTLARRTGLIASNEFLVTLSGVVSILLIIPRLGPAAYGAYASVFAVTGPLSAFSTTGLALVAYDSVLLRREAVGDVMRSCIGIVVGTMAITIPVAFVVARSTIDALTSGEILVIVATELCVASITFAIASVLQGGVSFRMGALVRVAATLLRMLAVVGLALVGRLDLRSLVVSQAAVMVALMGTVLVIAARHVPRGVRIGPVDRRHIPALGLHSTTLSAAIVQNDGDKVALQHSGFQTDTGVYAAAYRIASVMMVPVGVLGSSNHFHTLERAAGERRPLRAALRFARVGSMIGLVTGGAAFIAAPLLPRLLGSEYDDAIVMIRLLVPVLLLRSLSMFAMNGLLGLGLHRVRTAVQLLSATVAVAAYATLVPHHSWKGAVAGSAIAELTMFVTAWWALARQSARAFPPKHLARR